VAGSIAGAASGGRTGLSTGGRATAFLRRAAPSEARRAGSAAGVSSRGSAARFGSAGGAAAGRAWRFEAGVVRPSRVILRFSMITPR
jgi:hypothetical protein